MLRCPDCGLRQYAAVPYVEQPHCVACGAWLGVARPGATEARGFASAGARRSVTSGWMPPRVRTDDGE